MTAAHDPERDEQPLTSLHALIGLTEDDPIDLKACWRDEPTFETFVQEMRKVGGDSWDDVENIEQAIAVIRGERHPLTATDQPRFTNGETVWVDLFDREHHGTVIATGFHPDHISYHVAGIPCPVNEVEVFGSREELLAKRKERGE